MNHHNNLDPFGVHDGHDFDRWVPNDEDRSIRARFQNAANTPEMGDVVLKKQRGEVIRDVAGLPEKVAKLREIVDIAMGPNRPFTHGERWGDEASIEAIRQWINQIGTSIDELAAYIDDN